MNLMNRMHSASKGNLESFGKGAQDMQIDALVRDPLAQQSPGISRLLAKSSASRSMTRMVSAPEYTLSCRS